MSSVTAGCPNGENTKRMAATLRDGYFLLLEPGGVNGV